MTSTGWPAVRDTCAGFGVDFDPWQDGAGRVILSKRADGRFACGIGGVVMSIPRQVGKTFLVGAIVFALCLLRPGLTVLWTAHHSRTSDETFGKMQSFARRRKVAPHVAQVLIDDTTVKFHNGSRIMFGARERGFGRGFDAADVEVFDEAQILTVKAVDDMLPAMNTSPDGLALFLGTPPRPSDPSEVFSSKRKALIDGEDTDGALIEFGADRGADPNDRKEWARANPSYPARTDDTAMLRMKRTLPLDSFMREALGVWDDVGTVPTVIDPADWAALAVADPPADGGVSYGVKFSPDGETVALAVALRPDEGPVHVEGVEHRPMLGGVEWLEDWLVDRWRDCERIVVDGKSGAGALTLALGKRGIPSRRIVRPTTDQAIAAHATLVAAVGARSVSTIDDPALADAVACAGRRRIGSAGGWGFQSITEAGDVTLLEAVAFAHYGSTLTKRPRNESTSSGRRVVVLS